MKGNSSYKMSKMAKRQASSIKDPQARAQFKALTVAAEMAQKFAPKPRFDRGPKDQKDTPVV